MKQKTDGNYLNKNDLIVRTKSGDINAFRELVTTHQDRVFNTAIGLLQNREDAEDIAQEVFVEVHCSIGKFKGNSKLSTWIYRITVNKSLDFLRRKKRKKRFATVFGMFDGKNKELQYDPPADFVHPGVVLKQQEKASILFKSIDRLPEKQKTAFTFHYIEELNQHEIAEIMNTTVSSVESLLYRAKQNLRKDLFGYYKNYENERILSLEKTSNKIE